MNDIAPSNSLCAVVHSPMAIYTTYEIQGLQQELHTAFPAGNTDRIPSVLLFKQQK